MSAATELAAASRPARTDRQTDGREVINHLSGAHRCLRLRSKLGLGSTPNVPGRGRPASPSPPPPVLARRLAERAKRATGSMCRTGRSCNYSKQSTIKAYQRHALSFSVCAGVWDGDSSARRSTSEGRDAGGGEGGGAACGPRRRVAGHANGKRAWRGL